MFNFIELCAGAGGMSTGFIEAGFEGKILIDNDKNSCNTLRENHKNVEIINKDFRKIDYNNDKYKNIDVLLAGLPCQSFSNMGKRKGLDDKRGALFLDFISILQKILPKVFVIENVKGILSNNKGDTFKRIIELLNNIQVYNIYYKVLNANDYDVAQKRERIFIIGINKNINHIYNFPQPNKKKIVLRDVLNNIPPSKGYEYKQYKKDIMKLVPQDGCWVNLPIDIQKEYLGKSYFTSGGKRGIAKRLSLNKPCLTLTTSPCQKTTERCHPIYTRPLNIKEYARIQSFPDDYIFTGSISSQYKQIGNAVPVNLAKHIAISILKLFTTNK
jgi:DNA (cytosine-5)-methyltransferase 1